jgi:histidinol-phosphatase (PHP family)
VGEAVARALAALAASGVGLELNTRGTYRPGAAKVSPGPALLALAVRAGVPFVTLGSDAHQPEDVGRGLEEAVALARAAGVSKQCTFRRRRRQEHPVG